MEVRRERRQMKLYYFPFYRSNRCIWLVNELEANEDVKFEKYDTRDPDCQKVQQYVDKIHPHGTVPALQIGDDDYIIESGAICMYLAMLYRKFLPDPDKTMNYLNMIFYCCSTVDEILEHLFVQWALIIEPENRNQSVIESNIQKFKVVANYLEKTLQEKDYVCGDVFTAADCVLGYNLWWASVMKEGILLNDHPVLLTYFERLRERPAFKKTFEMGK